MCEPTPVTGVLDRPGATLSLVLLRLATGFVFLWAFLDKLFGLHYSTSGARA